MKGQPNLYMCMGWGEGGLRALKQNRKFLGIQVNRCELDLNKEDLVSKANDDKPATE